MLNDLIIGVGSYQEAAFFAVMFLFAGEFSIVLLCPKRRRSLIIWILLSLLTQL